MVAEDGAIAGLITLHEVKAVDRARWPSTLVSEVMRPLAQLRMVTPETPATEALEMLGHDDINQVPVVSSWSGCCRGIISSDICSPEPNSICKRSCLGSRCRISRSWPICHDAWMGICFALAVSRLGSVTAKTPSLRSAVAFSAWTATGSGMVRSKAP